MAGRDQPERQLIDDQGQAAGAVPERRHGAAHSLSVERVCRLLELFSAERPVLNLAEITGLLGWSKPTAHRYLMALRDTSFLRYDDALAEYRVGPKAISLAAAATAGLPLIALASPHMAALARATKVTTLLSVLGDESAVVVGMHDNTGYLIAIHVPVGTRLPLDRSAHGEVFLALEPGLEYKRRELAGDQLLQRRLANIHRLGIATNDDLVTGLSGVAAPLFAGDRLVGALGILGTSTMVPTDADSVQVQRLRAACRQISAELSGSSTPQAPVQSIASSDG